MLEGHTSEALGALAGETAPTMRDSAPLFETALQDMGIMIPDASTAIALRLKAIAARIVDGTTPPVYGAEELAALDDTLHPAPVWELDAFERYVTLYDDLLEPGLNESRPATTARTQERAAIEKRIVEDARKLLGRQNS